MKSRLCKNRPYDHKLRIFLSLKWHSKSLELYLTYCFDELQKWWNLQPLACMQSWRLYTSGKVSNLSNGPGNLTSYNQSTVKRSRDTPPSEHVTSCRVTYRDVRVPVSPSARWWPPGWAASWRRQPYYWSTWTGTRWAASGPASGWNHTNNTWQMSTYTRLDHK